jgi:hypothetical protein
MSSFVDLAVGEDAVTRISWLLRAVNAAAAAAAHMSAMGCVILQFFRKERFEESNSRPDRRKTFTVIFEKEISSSRVRNT